MASSFDPYGGYEQPSAYGAGAAERVRSARAGDFDESHKALMSGWLYTLITEGGGPKTGQWRRRWVRARWGGVLGGGS